MSDVSQGPGWWLASDGKWYPPQTFPGPAWQPRSAPQSLVWVAAGGIVLVIAATALGFLVDNVWFLYLSFVLLLLTPLGAILAFALGRRRPE
jgi:hypothetical protein